jgi:hypothetical protein
VHGDCLDDCALLEQRGGARRAPQPYRAPGPDPHATLPRHLNNATHTPCDTLGAVMTCNVILAINALSESSGFSPFA